MIATRLATLNMYSLDPSEPGGIKKAFPFKHVIILSYIAYNFLFSSYGRIE